MQPHPSTFSIVAHDPAQEVLGVAVHSKFISVGSVVPFATAGAGAIAIQSYANVCYGPCGLAKLAKGATAREVVEEFTAHDEEAPLRQLGVVGADG